MRLVAQKSSRAVDEESAKERASGNSGKERESHHRRGICRARTSFALSKRRRARNLLQSPIAVSRSSRIRTVRDRLQQQLSMTLELVPEPSFELLEPRRNLTPRSLEQLPRSVALAPRRRPSEAQSELVSRLQSHLESTGRESCIELRLDRVSESPLPTVRSRVVGSVVGRASSSSGVQVLVRKR